MFHSFFAPPTQTTDLWLLHSTFIDHLVNAHLTISQRSKYCTISIVDYIRASGALLEFLISIEVRFLKVIGQMEIYQMLAIESIESDAYWLIRTTKNRAQFRSMLVDWVGTWIWYSFLFPFLISWRWKTTRVYGVRQRIQHIKLIEHTSAHSFGRKGKPLHQ